MWTTILGFLASPLLNGLLKVYEMRLAAAGAKDQVSLNLAIETIKAEITTRQEATKVIIAEQGNWFTRAPRAIVQWSFALFTAKVVIWDIVLKLGHTDGLGGDIASTYMMVMCFWFGGRTLEKMTSIVAGRFGK